MKRKNLIWLVVPIIILIVAMQNSYKKTHISDDFIFVKYAMPGESRDGHQYKYTETFYCFQTKKGIEHNTDQLNNCLGDTVHIDVDLKKGKWNELYTRHGEKVLGENQMLATMKKQFYERNDVFDELFADKK